MHYPPGVPGWLRSAWLAACVAAACVGHQAPQLADPDTGGGGGVGGGGSGGGGTPSVAGAAGTLVVGGAHTGGVPATGGISGGGSAGTETGGSAGNAGSGGGAGNAGSGGSAGNGGSAEAGAAGAGGATEEAPSAIAIAKLEPTAGSSVTGVARFAQTGDQVKLTVTLTSCPAGAHALHLHMNPDCSDDAYASGGNWSPQGEDIDELTCADDGTATFEFMEAAGVWSIGGASSSDLLEHSVVLHAGGKPEPAGRIACGLPLVQP